MPDIPDSPLTAVEAAALRELYLRALAAGLMPTEEWPVGLSTGLVKIGRIAGRAKPGPAREEPIGLLRLAGQPDGQCCRIVLLEFADGIRAVVPWRCVRRVER